MSVRILYSFPHKIGAGRICSIAWHQIADTADLGADISLYTGVVHRKVPENVRVHTTLARGRWRIPYSAIGHRRALALHDHIVAGQLPKLVGEIDIVHVWPVAALQTLKVAKRLGIPTVLERPNAHTRLAYEVVGAECDRIGVVLPPGYEHAYDEVTLRKEEEEYVLADRLLCPSEFVTKSFRERGFPPWKLVRHGYGFSDNAFYPSPAPRETRAGLKALFVGVCAVRKGVHFALEAWLRSPASHTGKFRIAGEFLPAYERKLADMLMHPSVEVLGHRNDIPDLMRESDILLFPTIEEGYGMVCAEAIGSGCVPLVSDVCDAMCFDGENSLVHPVGDVDTLAAHITLLDSDRARLAELRAGCARSAPQLTWRAAGRRLLEVYEQVTAELGRSASLVSCSA